MNRPSPLLKWVFAVAALGVIHAQSDRGTQLVEQMRGLSMQYAGIFRSDGSFIQIEQRKQQIRDELRELGVEAMPALVHALSDRDVQMRRNAALVLIDLGGGYSTRPRVKVDIRRALPALIKATEDNDADVRGWAAHAIAEIGPDAKDAISALLRLLNDRAEGPRNTSCIALGRIGPAARDALPALREALNDPSKDVRGFAQHAIEQIDRN